MDVRNGHIHSVEAVRQMHADQRRHMVELQIAPTPLQRSRERVSRNDPCPCGSGRKFKKCHLQK